MPVEGTHPDDDVVIPVDLDRRALLLWLLSVATAGNLYINGTFVEPRSISGVKLEKVTVEFDDDGFPAGSA